MHTHTDTYFDGMITATHVYALGQGAVVTTPLLLTQEQYLAFKLKPGDEIDVRDPHRSTSVRCRILDIESIDAKPDHVFVRITLEGSRLSVGSGQ